MKRKQNKNFIQGYFPKLYGAKIVYNSLNKTGENKERKIDYYSHSLSEIYEWVSRKEESIKGIDHEEIITIEYNSLGQCTKKTIEYYYKRKEEVK